jgi:lambda family phage portal protein
VSAYLKAIEQVRSGVGQWSPKAGYVGGKRTRMMSSFLPRNRAADQEIKGDWDLLTARARWLCRNNPICVGAKDTLVNNLIGEGIQTRAHVRDNERTLNRDWNRKSDELYQRFMDEADIRGQHHWYELTRINLAQAIESGDGFLIQCQDVNPDRLVPICFELIEPDQIDLTRDRPRGDDVNEIRRGVELNANGKPVAYYVFSDHPGAIYSWRRRESERIPAWRVIHLFRQQRPSQTRGVTWFAPLVRAIWDLYQYMEHEIEAAKVASYFVYMLKREDVGNDDSEFGFTDENDETAPEDAYGNVQAPLGPGIGLYGGPNDSLDVIQSQRPNGNAASWIQLLMQMMGVSVGLSFQRFTGDFSRTNFSSARAADLQDRKGFIPAQSWHSWTVDLEVRRRVTRQLIAQGELTIPQGGLVRFDRNPRRWLDARARPPGWGYVDPTKQVKASIDAIMNGLSTWERELSMIGLDRDDVFETLAQEWQEATALGLPFAELLQAKLATAQARLEQSKADPQEKKEADE